MARRSSNSTKGILFAIVLIVVGVFAAPKLKPMIDKLIPKKV